MTHGAIGDTLLWSRADDFLKRAEMRGASFIRNVQFISYAELQEINAADRHVYDTASIIVANYFHPCSAFAWQIFWLSHYPFFNFVKELHTV